MNDSADVILRVAVTLDELPIALRLLQGIEIQSLDILDQRELGRRGFVDITHDSVNGV